mmetsp:Transcript_64396/g.122027  ORF Transcript_64396/g.122027 Transcript_64396/m.122027 type:complete len:606 (+) Transcript_64396:117-1934(+)
MGQAMGTRLSRCVICVEDSFFDDGGPIVPAQDPLTGSVNGRVQRAHIKRDYEIKSRVLGTGYSGGVRLAQSNTSKQQVAVKQFSKRRLEPHQLELLQSEVEVYLRLDHPNICRLLHAYETKHDVWLVMELCDCTLHSRLSERKAYHEKDAAELTLQMLQAVNYLHSQNIVHRDLKLENWMYGATEQSDRLKLIDFGLSRILRKPGETLQMPCGTLYYASPELLNQEYTSKCDLWSLGVICYMLLVGRPPFRGASSFAIAEAIMGTDTEFHKDGRWTTLSADAQDFVSQLLQKDERLRPDALKAMQHRWIAELATMSTGESGDIGVDVLKSLQTFARGSHLRRAALTMMAYSLTSRELEDLEKAFRAIDRTGRGTIKYDQLAEVLQEYLKVSSGEVSRIFQCLDFAHDEEIHYTPFIAAMLASRVAHHEDKARAAFEHFVTKEGDEFITANSLVEIFNGLTVPGKTGSIVDRNLTTDEAQQWICECDYKGNGVLDYDEFLAALMGKKVCSLTSLDETGGQPTVRVFDPCEDEPKCLSSSFGLHGSASRQSLPSPVADYDSDEPVHSVSKSFGALGWVDSAVQVRAVSCEVDETYFGGVNKETLQGA